MNHAFFKVLYGNSSRVSSLQNGCLINMLCPVLCLHIDFYQSCWEIHCVNGGGVDLFFHYEPSFHDRFCSVAFIFVMCLKQVTFLTWRLVEFIHIWQILLLLSLFYCFVQYHRDNSEKVNLNCKDNESHKITWTINFFECF